MAEPEQESELLDGSVSDCLTHSSDIVDASHEQDDQDGMSEELLSQALVDANAFDASAISYSVTNEEGEVCDSDTVQGHACVVNGGLIVDNSVSQQHISSNVDTILVHSSQSVLNNTSEAIYSNGSGCVSLLNNNGVTESEDMGVENSHSFDVGSLPDGHIISSHSDMIRGSVIVSQSNDDQYQQSVVDGADDTTQLLQDEIQEINSHYVQNGDDQILQHSDASQLMQSGTMMQPHTITVSAASGVTLTPEVLQNVIQQIQAQHLAQQQQTEVVAAAQRKNIPVDTAAPNTVSFTLVSPGQHHFNSPPLGSSQNPIRIIQQGNRYTPMQQLTQEQLQQIMQVVQQQHVNKNTQENGGAVIFNPQTNTRIMYRVIYPSELHKAQNGAGVTTYQVVKPTASQEQQTATPHQKRPYRKRKDAAVTSGAGEEEDKEKNVSDLPELSKEEKEERKKHRPRTRSGRVSKPPKHMVQDYKRIHVLDWDEDYDDSDGGYSDFKHSDEEGKNKQQGEEEHSTSPEFFQALGAGRPKNHKCQTCDKSYIGQAGLARHYRLNPDHCTNPTDNGSISSLYNGSIDGDDSKDASLPPDGSLSRMSDGAVDGLKTNFHASSIENISEDSNTQDSLNSTGTTSPVVRRGRGRGGFRGRWAHLKHNALIRRKNKLKELIKQCSDEDLMEVVLPRLVNSVSLWEYLMMKSENGGARPQVDVICREFETLRQHVKQACAEYMQPLTLEELEDDNLQCKMIKVSDKSLALCLNLDTVTYRVKEMPPGDSNSFSSLHCRLSPAAPALSLAKPTSAKVDSNEAATDINMKRSAVSNERDESTSKRFKISSNVSAPARDKRMSSSFTVSVANTFPAAATTAQYTESRINLISSEPTVSPVLSSLPSAMSLQSAQVSGHSSAISLSTSLMSSSSSSHSVAVASKSTSSNIRSPYIHISCPASKQQPVSNTAGGPRKHSPASSKASRSHPVTVAITESACVPESKSHMLPYIISNSSGSLTGHQQKVIFATSENQTLPAGSSSIPVVLAAPGTQQPIRSTAVLLTTSSVSSGSNMVVRQPAQTLQPHAHVALTNPSSSSRSQKGSAPTSSLFPSPSVSSSQTLAGSTHPRSLLGIAKPTEVRVSRQLFHETTSSPLTSSVVTNGHSSIKPEVASMDLHPALQHFNIKTEVTHTDLNLIPAPVSTSCHLSASIGSGVVSNIQQLQLIKPAPNSKTLMTPPSGQQFSTSPSKTVINTHMAGVDDISVLTGMDLSGDELGPLNTSSDSLNGALSGCSHLADSLMMSDGAAASSVSAAADESLLDMEHIVNSDMQAYDNIGKANLSAAEGIPLVNGNCSSYIKTKDCNIITHASSSSSSRSSLPLALSEASDFIHVSKSSSLVSSSCQDSTSIMQPALYHMAINGPVINHGYKSDVSIGSSIMMSDMTFPNQVTAHIMDSDSGQLDGISPILASDDLQENGISILSEPMSGTDTQEADGQSMDLGEVAISDSLAGEEDGQLLLSEGTNIYQTEDGTIIIQKANGNTYQLQGAQGLSLETVQALLSGTLDQLVGVDVGGEGVQTDTHLH